MSAPSSTVDVKALVDAIRKGICDDIRSIVREEIARSQRPEVKVKTATPEMQVDLAWERLGSRPPRKRREKMS